jgi:hypothetical protein
MQSNGVSSEEAPGSRTAYEERRSVTLPSKVAWILVGAEIK